MIQQTTRYIRTSRVLKVEMDRIDLIREILHLHFHFYFNFPPCLAEWERCGFTDHMDFIQQSPFTGSRCHIIIDNYSTSIYLGARSTWIEVVYTNVFLVIVNLRCKHSAFFCSERVLKALNKS